MGSVGLSRHRNNPHTFGTDFSDETFGNSTIISLLITSLKLSSNVSPIQFRSEIVLHCFARLQPHPILPEYFLFEISCPGQEVGPHSLPFLSGSHILVSNGFALGGASPSSALAKKGILRTFCETSMLRQCTHGDISCLDSNSNVSQVCEAPNEHFLSRIH